MNNTLSTILILTLLFIGIGFIFNGTISKHELQECKIWKNQSEEFRGWYSTSWQVEMCQNYDIDLSNYLRK